MAMSDKLYEHAVSEIDKLHEECIQRYIDIALLPNALDRANQAKLFIGDLDHTILQKLDILRSSVQNDALPMDTLQKITDIQTLKPIVSDTFIGRGLTQLSKIPNIAEQRIDHLKWQLGNADITKKEKREEVSDLRFRKGDIVACHLGDIRPLLIWVTEYRKQGRDYFGSVGVSSDMLVGYRLTTKMKRDYRHKWPEYIIVNEATKYEILKRDVLESEIEA